MVLKFKIDEAWRYVDNISEITTQCDSLKNLIEGYNANYGESSNDQCVYTVNGEKLPDTIVQINKAFTQICNYDYASDSAESHGVNLLKSLNGGVSIYGIWVKTKGKDCDTSSCTIYVTNQPVYLLNDQGKTIDRIA